MITVQSLHGDALLKSYLSYFARIKQVLVPKENKPDIQEIDAEILDGLKISYVDNMKEVLHEALAK